MLQPLQTNGALKRLAEALGVDPARCSNIRLSFPPNDLARMTVHYTLTDNEIQRLTAWCAEELDADGYQVISETGYSLVPKQPRDA